MVSLSQVESRQIPKVKKIISDKKYHDILYSYLQEASFWDGVVGHPRYIDKRVVNFSKIGKKLGMSRQTASKRFQNLISLGLITQTDEGVYNLELLPADVAALIPQETLTLLVNTLSDNAISTYVYLLRRWFANQESEFYFSIKEVKSFLGLSVNTQSNDNVISDILYVLEKLELIKVEVESVKSEEMHGGLKYIHKCSYLTNYIDKKC